MNVKTVYPIVTFCNETDQSKDIAISTYAFSYDYPKKIATIKPHDEIRIAVNPKTEIPQYLWLLPPFEGKASFLIDPDAEKVKV